MNDTNRHYPKTVNQQLDAIYNAFPEWARPLEGRSIAENIAFRFKELTDHTLEIAKRETETSERFNNFVKFVEDKKPNAYWEFLFSSFNQKKK